MKSDEVDYPFILLATFSEEERREGRPFSSDHSFLFKKSREYRSLIHTHTSPHFPASDRYHPRHLGSRRTGGRSLGGRGREERRKRGEKTVERLDPSSASPGGESIVDFGCIQE